MKNILLLGLFAVLIITSCAPNAEEMSDTAALSDLKIENSDKKEEVVISEYVKEKNEIASCLAMTSYLNFSLFTYSF